MGLTVRVNDILAVPVSGGSTNVPIQHRKRPAPAVVPTGDEISPGPRHAPQPRPLRAMLSQPTTTGVLRGRVLGLRRLIDGAPQTNTAMQPVTGNVGTRPTPPLDGAEASPAPPDDALTDSQTTPPGPRLAYNTTGYALGSPPTYVAVERYEAWLAEALGEFTVAGAESESERLAVTRALWLLTVLSGARGKETDLIIAIDGVPRELTVTMPDQAPALATLFPVSPWTPAREFDTAEEAIEALETEVGVQVVREDEGVNAWTLDELLKVHDAISRLSEEERQALAGVELVRVDDLGEMVAGRFSWQSKSDGQQTVERIDQLALADSAFEGDERSFVGNELDHLPASLRTIIHEIGHAVDSKRHRDALFALNQAVIDVNGNAPTYVAALNQALTDLARSGPAAEIEALQTFMDAAITVHLALNALMSEADPELFAERYEAVQTALAARVAAQTALVTTDEAKAAHLAQIEDDYASRVIALAERRLELDAAVENGRSRRLTRFVELVAANESEPVTDYAATNWPEKPGEFFAEAFALYRADPEFLSANRPALYDWFRDAGHLQ